jgi:hypothetical protein
MNDGLHYSPSPYVLQPSEVSSNTAAVISKLLPDYLDKRAFALVNGGVEETTVVLGMSVPR